MILLLLLWLLLLFFFFENIKFFFFSRLLDNIVLNCKLILLNFIAFNFKFLGNFILLLFLLLLLLLYILIFLDLGILLHAFFLWIIILVLLPPHQAFLTDNGSYYVLAGYIIHTFPETNQIYYYEVSVSFSSTLNIEDTSIALDND